ncbi:MAG TPA: glycoside hydrolase family 32 protein [Candidatus Faecousia excrementipullorum]|nr:glycoside hydrolase family 32 protein [Candidatus Faecousia excrementipullorum]
MQTYTLEKARAYETKYAPFISRDERPGYHLSPMVGWMNDPNGFCFHNGKYHIFYQYHPYSNHWGPMHWGHAVSTDLLHWQYLPVALAPDSPADCFGCFSGSAVTLPDGRHLLMYTGVQRVKALNELDVDIQNQCIAIGDGLEYEKYPGNPVISGEDLPENLSRRDFRDPKIWQEPDGSYRCVIGNRTEDGSGAILLFSSPDCLHWKYEGILDRSYNEYGRMWECPDFFPLDGKQVLMVNSQDMSALGNEFHNGNNSICILGHFDPQTKEFHREQICSVDYGLDFYATQTTLAPDGRRIMIAWMQNWDALGGQPQEQKWFGQLTIPRELRLQDGKLLQAPVREIEALRDRKVAYTNLRIREETTLRGIYGRMVDLTITVRPMSDSSYSLFRIKFAMGSQHYTSISYRPQTSELHLNRSHSGSNRDYNHRRKCLVRNRNGEIKLRLLLDRFSAEIFVNDGEQVLSTVLYTPQTADGISFLSDGDAIINVEKYTLIP